MSVFLKVMGFMLVFGSIIFLAIVCTKLVAGNKKGSMKGRFINIIESVSLGVDKQIHLVKVDNQFVLIATAGKNVEFLTNVKMDGYTEPEMSENSNNYFDFKLLFDKCIKLYKDKKSDRLQDEMNEIEEIEMGEKIIIKTGKNISKDGEVFKKNLSRLRQMTGGTYYQYGESGDDSINEN